MLRTFLQLAWPKLTLALEQQRSRSNWALQIAELAAELRLPQRPPSINESFTESVFPFFSSFVSIVTFLPLSFFPPFPYDDDDDDQPRRQFIVTWPSRRERRKSRPSLARFRLQWGMKVSQKEDPTQKWQFSVCLGQQTEKHFFSSRAAKDTFDARLSRVLSL